ncbi:hypothetical protein YPPY47_2233, partial [Yersinia pestis PY-47]
MSFGHGDYCWNWLSRRVLS